MNGFRICFSNERTSPGGTAANASVRQERLAGCLFRALFIVIPVLLLAGCTNQLGPLPSKAEIGALSIPVLKQRYPFLSELEPRNSWPYSSGTLDKSYSDPRFALPAAAGLIEKWGEPDHARLSWWSIETMFPLTSNHRWYWYINDKEVDAYITRPFLNGYTPALVSMTIRPKKQSAERSGNQ